MFASSLVLLGTFQPLVRLTLLFGSIRLFPLHLAKLFIAPVTDQALPNWKAPGDRSGLRGDSNGTFSRVCRG